LEKYIYKITNLILYLCQLDKITWILNFVFFCFFTGYKSQPPTSAISENKVRKTPEIWRPHRIPDERHEEATGTGKRLPLPTSGALISASACRLAVVFSFRGAVIARHDNFQKNLRLRTPNFKIANNCKFHFHDSLALRICF